MRETRYVHGYSSRGGALARRPVPRRYARLGGGSLVGRQLCPPLVEAAFRELRVSPRMVWVDSRGPDLAGEFLQKHVHCDGSKTFVSGRFFEGSSINGPGTKALPTYTGPTSST